jgi:hypothetical protein
LHFFEKFKNTCSLILCVQQESEGKTMKKISCKQPINELWKYKIALAAIQEPHDPSWVTSTYNIYTSSIYSIYTWLTNDSEEEAKDQFYEQLERAYSASTSLTSSTWDRGEVRKGINSIVQTIKGYPFWTLHTKYLLKYYTTACYPTPTRSFSITKLGSSQANWQQTRSLPCAKSWRKATSKTS